MPAQTSTKQIGSHTFTFAPLPAWDNFRGFAGLARLLGPAAPHVFKAFQVAMLNGASKKTREDWAPVAVGLLGTLPQVLMTSPHEAIEDVAKLLFKNVIVSSAVTKKTAPVLEVIDTLLQGDLMTFLELLMWCITEAYGGFFAEAMTRFAAKKTPEPSLKAEPLPSTSPTA